MIKSGDGTGTWSQFNPSVVSALHRSGLRVCAWQYVYGDHPITEAYVGAAAVRDGADCLIIDAEAQYEGKYVSAQAYMTRLRKLVGSSYPIALAGFPYVDYHPAFPYSVFLGPGGAQYNAPQMYWADIGTTVDAVYAHTYGFNRVYRRPIYPLGQVFDHPRAGQIKRFRQMSRSYGVGQRELVGLAGGDRRRLARAVAADRRAARLRPEHHLRHARDARARGRRRVGPGAPRRPPASGWRSTARSARRRSRRSRASRPATASPSTG